MALLKSDPKKILKTSFKKGKEKKELCLKRGTMSRLMISTKNSPGREGSCARAALLGRSPTRLSSQRVDPACLPAEADLGGRSSERPFEPATPAFPRWSNEDVEHFPWKKKPYKFGNFSYLIVDVAVCKHRVKILDTFLSVPVVVILQAFLYCSHIHRSFNYLIIILQKAKRETSAGGTKSSAKYVFAPGLRTGIPPSHPQTHLGGIFQAQQILSRQTQSPAASQPGFLIKQEDKPLVEE